ncbi:hypothetical protein HDU92_003867 [Lobulomyces angularis]|nr:hypothetical protein HDU92_003867 [Lobulomyces angularis]
MKKYSNNFLPVIQYLATVLTIRLLYVRMLTIYPSSKTKVPKVLAIIWVVSFAILRSIVFILSFLDKSKRGRFSGEFYFPFSNVAVLFFAMIPTRLFCLSWAVLLYRVKFFLFDELRTLRSRRSSSETLKWSQNVSIYRDKTKITDAVSLKRSNNRKSSLFYNKPNWEKNRPISPKQQRKQKLQTLSERTSIPKRPRDNLLETLITFYDKIEGEPEENKRMLSYNVTDSSVTSIESHDIVESRLKHVEDRLDKLENKVSALEKWMAKPCLHTALETTFKRILNIPSNEESFYDLLTNSTGEDVFRSSGIHKASWIQMMQFLSVRPNSRNDIIHRDIPERKLVESAYDHLKGNMDEETRRCFYSFLSI